MCNVVFGRKSNKLKSHELEGNVNIFVYEERGKYTLTVQRYNKLITLKCADMLCKMYNTLVSTLYKVGQ